MHLPPLGSDLGTHSSLPVHQQAQNVDICIPMAPTIQWLSKQGMGTNSCALLICGYGESCSRNSRNSFLFLQERFQHLSSGEYPSHSEILPKLPSPSQNKTTKPENTVALNLSWIWEGGMTENLHSIAGALDCTRRAMTYYYIWQHLSWKQIDYG